jgi:hypothetical protein
MLHSPSVQEELHLSTEQKNRIAEIENRVETHNQLLLGEVANGKITPAARLHRLREYRLDQNSDLLGVLNREQRQAFKQMAKNS